MAATFDVCWQSRKPRTASCEPARTGELMVDQNGSSSEVWPGMGSADVKR